MSCHPDHVYKQEDLDQMREDQDKKDTRINPLHYNIWTIADMDSVNSNPTHWAPMTQVYQRG